MVRCEKCETEIPYLPFRCKYCGKYFCRDHRLPENHQCTGRYNAPVIVVPTNVQKEMGIEIEGQKQKSSRKRLYQDVDETGRSLRRREPLFSSPKWHRFQESKFGRYVVTHVLLILMISGFILAITPLGPFVVLSPFYFFNLYFIHTIATAVFVPAVSLDFFSIFFMGFLLFIIYQFGKQLEGMVGKKFLIKFVFICGLLTGGVFVLSVLLFSLIPSYGIILYYHFPNGTTFGIIIGYIVFIAVTRPDVTFRIYFLPFQFKPKTIAIIFIAISIGLGFLYWASYGFLPPDSLFMCSGLQDLGGALGGYLIGKYGRGQLPTRSAPMTLVSQY